LDLHLDLRLELHLELPWAPLGVEVSVEVGVELTWPSDGLHFPLGRHGQTAFFIGLERVNKILEHLINFHYGFPAMTCG
jgi:hypothetical protein